MASDDENTIEGSTKKPCVLVGVTGCIAAYKSCELVRILQKAGCRVKVVMTEHATNFVGPLTFRALTQEPVAVDTFGDEPGDPIHHVSLAKEADVFVIAPCTANVVGKLAYGVADDLLTTTAMACTAPLILAPAMNVAMYESKANQDNLETLRNRGVRVIDADSGYLACGDEGRGRLPDPQIIAEIVLETLATSKKLANRKILITAGPTREPIDPVRYISNNSSGKTGYAIAERAAAMGADVTLVSGPVALNCPFGVKRINVETAEEMLSACADAYPDCDAAIFCAAVSDFRPKECSDAKLKKGRDGDELSTLELVENPDILTSLAKQKHRGQVIVGFAAETDNVIENAKRKLEQKGADFIVANEVGNGKVFGLDTTDASIVDAKGVRNLGPQTKGKLAMNILNEVISRFPLENEVKEH